MSAPGEETADPVDFLIVGAGPVGLLTAILLGQRGLSVTVLERWPARYPMPRACTIDHEALRILQSAGVMRDHSDLFEPSRGERGGYQIRNGDGVLLRAINWNRAAESGWANTNGFYQPDLEEVLEKVAVAMPTVDLQRGVLVDDIQQDEQSVTVTATLAGNESRVSFRARWLIGADGANSAIRGLIGIETEDAGFEADWLVVDYEPLDDSEWDAFVTQYCDPQQPATAVKSGPGRRRFEFMRRADVSVDKLGQTATAWELMESHGVTAETARIERHAVYTFRGRWAREWRRSRVFLAGDAAHLMPPFLGQGLCAGLRDASALAWRFALIESGLAGEGILDSYETERSAHVREIIDEAIAIGRVICELDPGKAAERDERMLAELHDPNAILVEPPHPQLGHPSITIDGDVNAGRLGVQARVQSDGVTGLFDDVIGGSWQLVSIDEDALTAIPERLRQWFEIIGGSITLLTEDGAVRDIDGAYRAWLREHGCTVALTRPDFYVYGTDLVLDAARLLQSLHDRLTGGSADHPQLLREGVLP